MTASAQAPAPARSPASHPGAWVHRRGVLSLLEPVVMGILNVTPDSFSDGGRHRAVGDAVRRAEEMAAEGAGIVDVGGESTRPGATPVPAEEEMARVLPVIRRLRAELPLPLSVDTRHAEVARAALEEGADVVNDVSGLADPAMAGVVVRSGAGLVLMHMRGTPATMQDDPRYHDVAAEVRGELEGPLARALAAGIEPGRVVVDPGIGFAKSPAHDLELIGRLEELARLGRPVVLGPSRKKFIGALLPGVPPAERGVGTAAACVVGLLHGARIFRVHDVRVVREALVVAEAIRTASASVP